MQEMNILLTTYYKVQPRAYNHSEKDGETDKTVVHLD